MACPCVSERMSIIVFAFVVVRLGEEGEGQRFRFCEEKRMPFRCGRGGFLTSDMVCGRNWKL